MISVKTDTLNVPITDISHVIIPTKLCSDSRLYGCTLTAHFFFLVNYNSIFIRAFSRLMILLNLRIILLFFIKTILNRAVSDKNIPPHKVLLELCRKKIWKYGSALNSFSQPNLRLILRQCRCTLGPFSHAFQRRLIQFTDTFHWHAVNVQIVPQFRFSGFALSERLGNAFGEIGGALGVE